MANRIRIKEFDLWRPGYGGAVVTVYVAGTTTPAVIYDALTDGNVELNPVTLLSRSDQDGDNYGKFPVPLYIESPYFLSTNGIEETGVEIPPMSTLDEKDASLAVVTPTGSSVSLTLANLTAREVYVENYGTIVSGDSGSAATNTATIELAIAALTNGGEVHISTPGRIKVTSFNVPSTVVVNGNGICSLESLVGDKAFVLTGSSAGFRNITLDGNTLVSNSIGIYSEGNDDIVLENVLVRRFETNMQIKGGTGHRWRNLSSDNADYCIRLMGDLADGNGGAFTDLLWEGGRIGTASAVGLETSYVDAVCQNIRLIGVGFVDSLNTAFGNIGGQFIELDSCYWDGNNINVDLKDDDLVLEGDVFSDNKTISIRFNGGRMHEGKFIATGTCQEVILDGLLLQDVAFQMDTPLTNSVNLINCTEQGVTISGEGTKILRSRVTANGDSFGTTTGNVATKAWGLALEPGQIVNLVGRVIGKQRNGAGRAIYNMAVGAYRPGATLAYDTQTANFTLGNIVTGASSGAVGRIITDTDGGVTGTLTLTDITGEFVDNEIITDASGSATVNGTLGNPTASLDTVGNVNLRTPYETDASWNAAFVANGPEIELQVTGNTGVTVEWTVNVDVVTT